MPSNLHELFIADVVNNIDQQLSRIATGQTSSADFARRIKNQRHADIKPLDPEYGVHSPDSSYRHSDAQLPGVVIEISYSQKRKDLHHLADDYILGSNHNIRAVVGLDVEYNGLEAVLSMWKPGLQTDDDGSTFMVAEQVVADQVWIFSTETASK